MNIKTPKVTLVGAGPGDPELITLKGVKAIKSADVILYDALAHPDLLHYARPECRVVFVGKKVGVCQFKQEEINQLVVDYAQSEGHVVRLKGGDPFVFGRGHEELIIAKSQGITVEVIPGVSSFYSVPELDHVPITRRGINESFWVVTGTTRDHQLSGDIAIAAKSNATVIILMGTRKLPEIVEIFKNEGKSSTPVMVIQNGSLPHKKIALGTIATIVEEVKNKDVGSPAVIVIGGVVNLHPDIITDEILASIL